MPPTHLSLLFLPPRSIQNLVLSYIPFSYHRLQVLQTAGLTHCAPATVTLRSCSRALHSSHTLSPGGSSPASHKKTQRPHLVYKLTRASSTFTMSASTTSSLTNTIPATVAPLLLLGHITGQPQSLCSLCI